MPVARQDYRDAMARLGAAVNIITTGGAAGRAGFTASAVCSVTDEPATLLVCLNRTASAGPAVRANGVLCVNVLAHGQQELAAVFAGVTKCTQEERFAGGTWTTLETGAPALDGAVVSFDCRIVDLVDKGTHTVLFAEVVAVSPPPPKDAAHPGAMIYYGREYHPVGSVS